MLSHALSMIFRTHKKKDMHQLMLKSLKPTNMSEYVQIIPQSCRTFWVVDESSTDQIFFFLASHICARSVPPVLVLLYILLNIALKVTYY